MPSETNESIAYLIKETFLQSDQTTVETYFPSDINIVEYSLTRRKIG